MKNGFFHLFMLGYFDVLSRKTPPPPRPLVVLAIVIYFLQTLGTIFELQMDIFRASSSGFMAKIAFYSNPANFLSIVSNTPLFTCIYLLVLIFIFTTFLLMFLCVCSRLWFGPITQGKTRNFVKILSRGLFFYEFVLVQPCLQILMCAFDCQTQGQSSYFHCESPPFSNLTHAFITVPALFLAFFLGVLQIFGNRNFHFGFRVLNHEPDLLGFTIYFCRCLLVLLQTVFNNHAFACYVLANVFGIFSIVNGTINSKFLKDEVLKKVFFSLLGAFQAVAFILTLRNYSSLIDDENLVYIMPVLVVLSFKLGLKLAEKFVDYTLIDCSNEIECFDEKMSLIRTKIFFDSKQFINGFFKNHFRGKCKDSLCQAEKNSVLKQNDQTLYLRAVDQFIRRQFLFFLGDKALKSRENLQQQIVMQYIDFLFISSRNSMFLMFEFEKTKSRLKKKPFFLMFLLKWLSERIKDRMMQDENQAELSSERHVDLCNYFRFSKYKLRFEELSNSLLLEKRKFWANYLNGGFQQMASLVVALRELIKKIEYFDARLQKYCQKPDSKVLELKLRSILNCLFYNNVDKALKYEGDFESFFSVERSRIEKTIGRVSFLNKDIVTLEASFLSLEGIIKPGSKRDKVCQLFGYTKTELPYKLEGLMPQAIAKYHSQFVAGYVSDKRVGDGYNVKGIQSFGFHRKGYVFPLTIFYGVSYGHPNDFVLTAALVPENKDQLGILFLVEGVIIGLTLLIRNFMFKKSGNDFLIEHLDSIQVYDLFTELKELVDGFKEASGQLRNHRAVFSLPIVNKDDVNSQTLSSSRFSKFQTLLKSIYTTHCRRFEVTFDLSFSTYTVVDGKTMKVCFLNLKNVSKTLRNDKMGLTEFNKTFKSGKTDSCDLLGGENNKCEDEDEDEKIEFEENVPPTCSAEQISDFEKMPKHIDAILRTMQEPEEEEGENTNQKLKEIEKKIFQQRTGDGHLVQTLAIPEPKISLGKNVSKKLVDIEHYNDGDEQKNEESSNDRNFEKNSSFAIEENSPSNQNKVNPKVELTKKPGANTSQKVETMKLEVFSKHSSSIKLKSKNFRVFKSVAAIREHVPWSFYLFFFGLLCEFLLILIYTIIVSLSEAQYFELRYNPTKLGMINFCRLYSSLSFATAITIEFEYLKLGLKPPNPTYDEKTIYFRIIERSFASAKEIVYSERNSPQVLNYQSIYRTYMTWLINFDYNPKRVDPVTYFELLDFYLAYMKYLESEQNFSTMNYDFLIFQQRNFPYFLLPSAAIFSVIQNSFTGDNVQSNSDMQNILVIFLVLMFMIKLFEVGQLMLLHNYLLKVLLIFMRTNTKDVCKELFFLDQTIEEFREKNEDYFYSSFAYKCIERQNKFRDLEMAKTGGLSHQEKSMDRRAKKYKGNRNMKSLTQTSNFFIVLTMLSLSFCYYFFNFYYWLVVNSNIKDLISINISFASIYVYSSSILTCNNNLIRERIITNNTSYQLIPNSTYQTPSSRITYFNAAINKRLPIVTNVAQNELPTRIFQAEGYISDPNFHELTKSDICSLLHKLGDIQDDEKYICQRIWSGSLTKGLLIGINHYFEMLQEVSGLRNNTNDTAKQIKQAKDYIGDWNHTELFMGDYFLNQGLYLFYQYINNYYDFVIANDIYTLKVLLIVTTLAFAVVNMVAWYLIWRHFKNFFRVLGSSLFLMPYEKITEDEATYQIINSFLK